MSNEIISDDKLQEAKSEWENYYRTSAGPTHNVIGHVLGVGIGPQFTDEDKELGANCLHFYVEKKIKPMEVIENQFLRINKEYKGVPTKVMETGRLVSFQCPSPKAKPGTSVGLDPRGLPSNLNPAIFSTLGAVVSMGGRQHYILGSNHAMAVNGRAIGMQLTFKPPEGFIDDPNLSIIARVTNHVHLHSGLNEVDCALARLDEYLDLDRIRAEFPNHLVMAEDGIAPTVNMEVARVDDTERATGKIISVSAHPRFHFNFGAFDFTDLVLIEGDDNKEYRPFARPGDSGALVVGRNKPDEKFRPTAIVIGGSRQRLKNGRWKSYTFACSFNKAMEQLKAEFPKPHDAVEPYSADEPRVVFTITRSPVNPLNPQTPTDPSKLRNRRLATRPEEVDGAAATTSAGGGHHG